jgi:hypothetical protein
VFFAMAENPARRLTLKQNLWSSLPEKLANSDLHSRPTTRKRDVSSTKKVSTPDELSMPPPALTALQRPKATPRQSSQSINSRLPIFERRAATQGNKMHMSSAVNSGSSSSSNSGNSVQIVDPQQAAMMQQAQMQLQQHQHLQRQQSYQDQQMMQQQQQHSQNQPFAYGNLQHPSNLNDLANLMFPSADPFAYPVPPMTTLEQSAGWGTPQGQAPPPLDRRQSSQPSHMHDHRTQHPNPHGQGQDWVPASTAGADTVDADEHIDVQLFGPMPPYLMPGYATTHQQQLQQQQQQEQQQQQQQQRSDGQYQQGHQQMRQDANWNQMDMESYGYDDIFGDAEEWRGSLM